MQKWVALYTVLHKKINLVALLLTMETLARILPWIQIVLSLILVVAVLLQANEAGLGAGFGGGGETIEHTRRGFEKTLFHITIVIGILFALSALAALFVH